MKAQIVFSENGDFGNLFAPILCDAIRTARFNVKHSLEKFRHTDIPYDIVHSHWPEEGVGWECNDASVIVRMYASKKQVLNTDGSITN